jgi:taurine dioxygenase
MTGPIEIRPLTPFGVEIAGVDLSEDMDEGRFRAIEEALDHHGVVVIRGQALTPERQIAFTRRFGELEVHVRQEYALPGHPEIHLISNIKDGERSIGSAYAGDNWHTDLCFQRRPARMSLLHGIEIPHDDAGEPLGDTLFVSAADAYDRLPDDMKRRLEGLRAIHQYHRAQEIKRRQREKDHARAALSDAQRSRTPDVAHPVVRRHPVTGRKCLYVNQTYTFGIEGWPEEEAEPLLRTLFAHIVQEPYVYRHRWRAGDVVMWDNCLTQHKAVADYALPQRRLMHRTAVNGTEPV